MNTILSIMDYFISLWSRHTCLWIDIITNILPIINSFL
ncbi:sorbitol-specific phosphotransferase system component IIC [Enterobacter sp. Sphag1F]|nr:sorbitol-specific phosphotransferase system component IIC [Enterobacter sp. Sphag1F]NYI15934.1 sorbitol-specific phosphotransferase system component IIC [Enterobacter sp. Sphag71]